MDNKYIKIIKDTPLFQGMSDKEIAQFLRPDGSGIKSFRKESYIFHAGDKTAYFGILLEGKALIERDELWGGRSIIAPLEAGQLFGEVYACTGEPLGVSVCAKEQCTVLFLSPESIIKESSTLTARLLKITAMKNLRLNENKRACYGLSFFACKEKRIAHCHHKFRPSTACRFSLR
jgi:CRP-like cAMP-binding protein